MKYIKGIRIKNYRVLRDIAIGSVFSMPSKLDAEAEPFGPGQPLSPLTVVIGRNGYGKSTLCDAFGFIVDCLRADAEQACVLRGGFDKIVSDDSDGILEFQIRYASIQYSLSIKADEYNVPYVYAETLSHIDPPFATPPKNSMSFFAQAGKGKVVRPNAETVNDIQLADPRRLVLSTLGNLAQFPDIVAFREFLDSWYLCYFEPENARSTPLAGPQRHLSRNGSNLANVVQYWERKHKDRLDHLTREVLRRVLGIVKIETHPTEDGRLLLRFYEEGSRRPFYASQMSDGTLKLVAYLMLLGDPQPPPFVCFEEPENGLYHKLLGTFVNEIRKHTQDENGSQFFITTHQPYLVDALSPKEVWILEKGDDAFARVRRASDDPIVSSMVGEGMPLGALWFSEYLENGLDQDG